MAKQIRNLHAQFVGDSSGWTKLNVIYTVEDSADTSMDKNGQVIVSYETTDTIAELHTAIKTAVETEEGIS
jgi:hypothetical protein